MSGPKTSRYVLTREQRKAIEDQVWAMVEIKAAYKKHRELLEESDCLLKLGNSALLQLESLQSNISIKSDEITVVVEKWRDIAVHLSSLKSVNRIEKTVDDIKKENEELEKLNLQFREINNNIQKCVKKTLSDYSNELLHTVSKGFSISFKNLGEERNNHRYISKINNALSKIRIDDLPQYMIERFHVLQERADFITDENYLENFYTIQVCPFINECKYYKEHISEFEDLIIQYEALAAEANESVHHFTFSKENMISLNNEIHRLIDKIVIQREQAYISDAVNQAMIEMGYVLVGERNVAKKNGVHFHNDLYNLREGTAVSVTFSNSGQISMELGALDSYDRAPSEEEAKELENDMKAFCQDYNLLEDKLIQKGVITQKLVLIPPSAEYAQIFNVNDYVIKENITVHPDNQSKRTSKQTFYKEG